jgi:hypothetical protein
MNKAKSSQDRLERMKAILGLPFVNTIAADIAADIDANGPVAEALLRFSQSADLTSPFNRDQTGL